MNFAIIGIENQETVDYSIPLRNMLDDVDAVYVATPHLYHYQQVKQVVEEAYPQLSVVYTIADVCRAELLVEIEGILISQ